MQIIGIVDKVIFKANPPKRIAVIIDQVTKSSWAIEFRKQLMHQVGMIKEGEAVRVDFENQARIDSRENTYNNAIAIKIERL